MWREESDFLAASPLTRARARAPQNVRLLADYAMFSHGILSYFVCVEKRKTWNIFLWKNTKEMMRSYKDPRMEKIDTRITNDNPLTSHK